MIGVGEERSEEFHAPEGWVVEKMLPHDLGQLYFSYEKICLFPESKYRVQFLDPHEIKPFDWNEPTDNLLGLWGPLGHTWYPFAKVDGDHWLAVYLRDTLHWEPSDPDHLEAWNSSRVVTPIAVISDSRVAMRYGNPVIGISFSEVLKKLLQGEGAKYFWEADDFKPLGEASELTRIRSRD